MTVNKSLLQSPYKTDCRAYQVSGFHNRHHCVEECMAFKVWERLNKVSLMSPVTKPFDFEPLSFNGLINDDVAVSKFREI